MFLLGFRRNYASHGLAVDDEGGGATLRCRIHVHGDEGGETCWIEIFPESDGTFVAQIELVPNYMEMPYEVPNGDYGFTVGAWFGYSFATLYSFELYWE